MGRTKLWELRILLPLKHETLDHIDASLADGEARLDFIREAIARELKRRQKAK